MERPPKNTLFLFVFCFNFSTATLFVNKQTDTTEIINRKHSDVIIRDGVLLSSTCSVQRVKVSDAVHVVCIKTLCHLRG